MQIMDIHYRNYDCMKKLVLKYLKYLLDKNQIKKRLRVNKTMVGRLN